MSLSLFPLLFNSIFIFMDGSGADIGGSGGDGGGGDNRVLFHRTNAYIMETHLHIPDI